MSYNHPSAQERNAEIIGRGKNGESLPSLARAFGLTAQRVWYIVVRVFAERKQPSCPTATRANTVVRMRTDADRGADGVRYPAGRVIWAPKDGLYQLIISQLVLLEIGLEQPPSPRTVRPPLRKPTTVSYDGTHTKAYNGEFVEWATALTSTLTSNTHGRTASICKGPL